MDEFELCVGGDKMILDRIENASQYANLHKGIDMALSAMTKFSPQDYPVGKHEIDGENVFLLLNAYQTHDPEGALSEAHRKYIDVMYMVDGEEIIYVKSVGNLKKITKEYDPQIEALLAETDDDATPVRLTTGSFAVLFPQDAHAPGCWVDSPKDVKKIIGKVMV